MAPLSRLCYAPLWKAPQPRITIPSFVQLSTAESHHVSQFALVREIYSVGSFRRIGRLALGQICRNSSIRLHLSNPSLSLGSGFGVEGLSWTKRYCDNGWLRLSIVPLELLTASLLDFSFGFIKRRSLIDAASMRLHCNLAIETRVLARHLICTEALQESTSGILA